MPMKPHKDETQSEFMARCLPEMMGENGGTKRPREQAVAACLSIWREAHPRSKGLSPEDFEDIPDPNDDESEEDFIERCVEALQNEDPDLDDDKAAQICQLQYDQSQPNGERSVGDLVRKTHARSRSTGMEFVLSDESIDRMGDVVSTAGWQTDAFKTNPIALFNHRSDFPIGQWSDLGIKSDALRANLTLAPEGTSPRIDEIRRLVDAGILRASSVGFRALEHEPIKDASGSPTGGIRFVKQELIEVSLVSVPANRNALAVAKSLKISPETQALVFAKHGNRDRVVRRGLTGKHANSQHRRNGRGNAMSSLAQRITALQDQIREKQDALSAHLQNLDDNNVSDADLETSSRLNADIERLQKTHQTLVESERLIGASLDGGGDRPVPQSRSLVVSSTAFTRPGGAPAAPGLAGAPAIVRSSSLKERDPIEYFVRAGTTLYAAKIWGMMPEQARQKIYGDDDATRMVCDIFIRGVVPEVVRGRVGMDLVLRAESAPAFTTVTGWAAELVHQIYTDLMPLLIPHAIYTRLAQRGLALSFGRAGRIIIPTRSRVPSLAGSFVGEGQPIPVRQGAFTSQTLTPKKVGVITSWSREIDEFSIPAIEGVLREAVQVDTGVAIDTILIDANPATVVRPAGLLNGLTAITPTPIGTPPAPLNALVSDLQNLIGGLTASTYGNVRAPVWLMHPTNLQRASLTSAANTGIFPFRDEIKQGTLNNIPYIDSVTVPLGTMILIDAADFVAVGSEGARLELSDQATLHMEDTNPLPLVDDSGPPGVVAQPQRSLFQTDSIALRLIMFCNWVQRRAGTIVFTQGITW
jgi:HK97 family phage prohead protease